MTSIESPAIEPAAFAEALAGIGVDVYAGVPDSLLAPLTDHLDATLDARHFWITANEGNAVGLAAGHYLATGRPACVFTQNAGLGNTVNPLLSLMDEAVYRLPMLLVVGWRGEPGVPDEPQHAAQGALTLPLLETLGIEYAILQGACWRAQVAAAGAHLIRTEQPYALVVRKGAFAAADAPSRTSRYPMTREQALATILDGIGADAVVVATTGKASREIFELRERAGAGHARDFLTVGAMGHASSIALGVSLGTDAPVWCLDGDGSCLMHLGAAAVVAQGAPASLRYVVIDNGAHESVGGAPTLGFAIDLPAVLRGLGFAPVRTAEDPAGLAAAVAALRAEGGALVVYTGLGARADLGRPTVRPQDNKAAFMATLAGRRNA
ncbi:MAG: phosphonopyruvate decarboxylase, partial [Actinomycetia bacterium]|nr:phosphonopyruvate decarboxylase [Actinomycetes bacterium]